MNAHEIPGPQRAIVGLLLHMSKQCPPADFRTFLSGAIIANVVGNLSDEYWREFSKMEICDEPGCDCYVVATKLVEALDALRDDHRKTMSSKSANPPPVMRKRYVLGFLFEDDLSSVVLIQKEKPAWQAGRRNGVGGKIKPDESEADAMSREFLEETGVKLPNHDWHQFCEMAGKGFVVYCFTCGNSTALSQCRTMTEEKIWITNSITFDGAPVVENVEWLVPLAKAWFRAPFESTVHLT